MGQKPGSIRQRYLWRSAAFFVTTVGFADDNYVRGALRQRLSAASIPAERNLGTTRKAAGTEDDEEKQTGVQRHDPECRECDINRSEKKEWSGNVAVDSPAPGCVC